MIVYLHRSQVIPSVEIIQNLQEILANYQLDKLSLTVSQLLDICRHCLTFSKFQVQGDEPFLKLLDYFPTATHLALNVKNFVKKHHILK